LDERFDRLEAGDLATAEAGGFAETPCAGRRGTLLAAALFSPSRSSPKKARVSESRRMWAISSSARCVLIGVMCQPACIAAR